MINSRKSILYSMLAVSSLFGGLPIIENKKTEKIFICPNCKQEHIDKRGYCSKSCFIEHSNNVRTNKS